MNRKEIKNQLLEQMNHASRCLDDILNTPEITLEQTEEKIHQYICSKFLLDATESKDASLRDLAKKSLEKALKMEIVLTQKWEKGASCGSAGTMEMKLTLLFMAIRKDLGMDLPPVQLGSARTSRDVGRVVYDSLAARKPSLTATK